MSVKGEKTKQVLYDSAKYIFYHKGYNKAMIKEIVERAGSHLGVFTYYFKNKEELGISIFNDFISGVSRAIKKTLDASREAGAGIILLNMIEYRAYYMCLVSGPNIQNFYYDITQLPTYPNYLKGSIKGFLQKLIHDDLSSELCAAVHDPAHLNAIVSLATGMELQFFRDLTDGDIEMGYADAVDLFLNEYYRLILKDDFLIKSNLKKSREIVDSLAFHIDEAFNVRIKNAVP